MVLLKKQGDVVSLSAEQLSPEQQSELITLCEQKLQEFLLERGEDFWVSQYEAEPVPLSSRYEVLKRAGKAM